MSKKKLGWTAAALGLIGTATVAFAYFRTDPDVAKAKALAAGLNSASQEQRKAQWQKLRSTLDKMSPDQRRQVMDQMRAGFEERQREEMKRYFAMSPKERTAYLDKMIKDSEKRRRDWAAKAQNKTSTANVKTQTGNANTTNNNNGGRPGRQPMSAEQRDQLRKQRLDNSSPEDRAQRAEFRRQMDIRRRQLGLPPGGGRGGR